MPVLNFQRSYKYFLCYTKQQFMKFKWDIKSKSDSVCNENDYFEETNKLFDIESNPDAKNLTLEFTQFGQYGEKVKKDFLKCCQAFINKIIILLEHKSIENISDTTQNYYTLYNNRVNSIPLYQDLLMQDKEELVDFFERYTMKCLYSFLFCSTITNDEKLDMSFKTKINRLGWITAPQLDSCLNEACLKMSDLSNLLDLDSFKSPQEKLNCILKCCKRLIEELELSQKGPVGADQFLPALIYFILKINPDKLKSNILYVTRFCKESKLIEGEAGYYFTNMCCAVSFIENLTAESLDMKEKDFEAHFLH